MLVPLILRKVLDETTCEVFCFAIPLVDVGISVARIEDLGGNAVERSRDFKIEVRNGLRGCFFDVAVEDCVDYTTSIFYGDTLARSVPTGVDEVGFCAALLHFLTSSSAYFVGCNSRKA